MRSGIGVALAVGLLASSATAQEGSWRLGNKSTAPAAGSAGVSLGKPQTVTLGQPEALDTVPGKVQPANYLDIGSVAPPVARGQAYETPWVPALGAPQPVSAGLPVTPVMHTAGAPPPPPPPDPLFVAPPPPPPGNPIPPPPHAPGGLFGCEWLGCTTGAGRKMFESDHDFDGFISPMTNPFLFEDPRSLTEVRPILMYQSAPHSNPVFNGGNLWFLGTQARLAITERFSIVMNKLGFVWTDPNDNPFGVGPHFGFSEFWIGPKLTFWRNDKTCSIAAAGVTLQIPAGGGDVFQNTGTLTVAPYITYAQGFLRDFHFMTTAGYAIGDNARTDYFYNSYHLDYDVGGLHKIYPLVELNWVSYTGSGGDIPINFEGRDLINFGAEHVAGRNSLTLAFGARYKFSECLQTGLGLEFPLVNSPDLLNFRLTMDLIWRY
ncbi:hypothetical protein AYO44_08675 [Planctomycetaceae bacterium SCGC AG-212-F19]|nr:hypothetical protein AYO44_08675 [Planctomycetaceae bacterium SCGC AG-212-F19]